MSTTQPEEILHSYLHVQDGGKTEQIAVTEQFWSDVVNGARPELDQGRLMSAFSFSANWPSWERHPAGEELVMLLSGSAVLLLEEANGERALLLDTVGSYVLVPQGVWHTARTTQPTTLLFLTPGAGTEHRPV
ncbi:MAG: cupin domain-containing protein [Gammaproteobacteria bacterium]|jgi:mannose-6-phosphate isomerase-like protein (cupin superfamily)|nr:cupin domain-containing protein [Gammaproteobacteria bacterium]MBU2154439.1 cupin domain-containing protein [Gammaproteobacteria bacterium]MBU2253973.1 cupin domain-containing protein [Gammaproteobacteria bacterium]MBU2295779.1 cupin domain-containing protein [Gammaproteobacteria bacterium]